MDNMKKNVVDVFSMGILALISFLQDIIWNLSSVGKRGEDKVIIIPDFLGMEKKIKKNQIQNIDRIANLGSQEFLADKLTK